MTGFKFELSQTVSFQNDPEGDRRTGEIVARQEFVDREPLYQVRAQFADGELVSGQFESTLLEVEER